MANAKIDGNFRPALICASKTNGTDVVRIKASPTAHSLVVDDNTTGSDNGNNNGQAMLDGNRKSVLTAVSSVDGVSIVEVYADPITGALLIDSS